MTLEDTWRDLDEFVASQDLPDFDSEPVPAESLDQANRWLRAIKRIDRRVAEIREVAAAERQRINEWEAEQVAAVSKNRAWLERSIELLARALFQRDPKVITRSLPNGEFTLRKQQPDWSYTDEKAFVEWAKVHRRGLLNFPDPPEPKPDKNAVKKAFEVDGKPGDTVPVVVDGVKVPGLTVTFRDRRFEIKTEGP